MKIKILASLFLAAFVCCFVIYACRKPELPKPLAELSQPTEKLHSIPRRTSTETFICFSKDSFDVVYKMTIIANMNDEVEVDREIYETNRADTFKVIVYVVPGVNIGGGNVPTPTTSPFYGQDTVRIGAPDVDYYQYVIPFNPSIPFDSRNNGGGALLYYCQCCCLDCDADEELMCFDTMGMNELSCVGVCSKCYAVSTGCPSRPNGVYYQVSSVGGFAVINGKSITIIN